MQRGQVISNVDIGIISLSSLTLRPLRPLRFNHSDTTGNDRIPNSLIAHRKSQMVLPPSDRNTLPKMNDRRNYSNRKVKYSNQPKTNEHRPRNNSRS